MMENELCQLPAARIRQLLGARQVSCREVVEAHLARIAATNPHVNAVVTLTEDLARKQAEQLDQHHARGEPLGILHGLPVVHKDLFETKGIRTTYGSPLFQDYIPTTDALIVQRLRKAGAITLGKSNTPEFGAGSQTFNPVFGATRNPYDVERTCGGSSGGAAVSLACGMVALADGSDTGGSLRNPASFCNVVGFRPSAGRVPVWPEDMAWFTLSVQGPMGRTVQDVALMLAAIAGPDPLSPIGIHESGDQFLAPLERSWQDVRLAWSPTLGGLPVDPQVTQVLESALPAWESIGCHIEVADPDFRDVDSIFKTLRAWRFELHFSALIEKHGEQIKETIRWNAEQGAALTGPQLARVEQQRTRLYHRLRRFFEQFDYLLAPVVQVPPFPLDQPYVTEIQGVPMESYIDWMRSCYLISATGLPAISVPAGFTPDGLPVGLQIIGKHQDDRGVLQLAFAFQEATGFWKRRPSLG
jgi:amidase